MRVHVKRSFGKRSKEIIDGSKDPSREWSYERRSIDIGKRGPDLSLSDLLLISFGNQGPSVWRKNGGAHRIKVALSPVWSFHSQWWFVELCLPSLKSSRTWHLPTLPKVPKPGLMTIGLVCLIGQQTLLIWPHRKCMGYCQEGDERPNIADELKATVEATWVSITP